MAKWVAWREEVESQSSVALQEGERHHLSDRGAHPHSLAVRGVEIVSSPQLVALLGTPELSAQAGAFF